MCASKLPHAPQLATFTVKSSKNTWRQPARLPAGAGTPDAPGAAAAGAGVGAGAAGVRRAATVRRMSFWISLVLSARL